MQHHNRRMVVVISLIALFVAALQLSGCSVQTAVEAKGEDPSTTESVEGSEYNRVTLSAKAADRLGVQTEQIREEQVDGVQRLVAPYAALIYGNNGETWVYTSPEALTFMRQAVTVDSIDGDLMLLVDGPAVGTEVATVAVAELYGADTGVGK